MGGRAKDIVAADLKGNCVAKLWKTKEGWKRKKILETGWQKFKGNVWARDFACAVPAMLELGMHEEVYNTLEAFYDHIEAGQFPRKLDSHILYPNLTRNMILFCERALHKIGVPIRIPVREKMKPEYTTTGGIGLGPKRVPKDTTPHILFATAEHDLYPGVKRFADDHRQQIEDAINRMEGETSHNMIWQYPCEDWRDIGPVEGYVFKTNLERHYALSRISMLYTGWDMGAVSAKLEEKAASLKIALNDLFWDEQLGHFITAITSRNPYEASAEERVANFSVPENMLAITTGFATTQQRKRIIEKLEQTVNEHGYVPIVTPGYDDSKLPLLRRLFEKDYNNGTLMLPWIQALAIEASAEEHPALAKRLHTQLSDLIEQHGPFEVFSNNKPYQPWYLSGFEKKFTWGAAGYLKADKKLADLLAEPVAE